MYVAKTGQILTIANRLDTLGYVWHRSHAANGCVDTGERQAQESVSDDELAIELPRAKGKTRSACLLPRHTVPP